MKLTYNLIDKNLKIYNEAREKFPIILDYENKTISRATMTKVGLINFADFHDFKMRLIDKGFEPIIKITYRKLKPLIIENTITERFKTYIKNRPQKQFIGIFNNYKKFNRLLEGRIISRNRRGDNRSHERIEGLTYSIIPILNYLISNDIEVSSSIFTNTSHLINNDIRWYIKTELEYDNIKIKEIELTKDLINNFIDIIEVSKIDFRKLNIDYITDTLVTRFKNLMKIKVGTNIKCQSIKNYTGFHKLSSLTEGKFYTVENSYIQQGHLTVMIRNDVDRLEWYDYILFEDMAIKREQLLEQLLSK
jgi:hypothetical protein